MDGSAVDVHPFAPELRSIFRPEHGVAGGAVFCVDRVPTVCLISRYALSSDPDVRMDQMRRFCERLWNQNLVRAVLVVSEDHLEAWSVDNPEEVPQGYTLGQRDAAQQAWSVAGLLGGEVLRGRDNWFDPKRRVDKILLDDILMLVAKLTQNGQDPAAARRLVARIIFIAYLEDRGIVGETYRSAGEVRRLVDLVREHDRVGLRHLVKKLRSDFNGDFLTSADSESGWEELSDRSFDWISDFLSRTALRTGQASFWRYDFSQIPIELIASIYETFLASKDTIADGLLSQKTKRKLGAYYTPRLLADWIVDLAIEDRDVLSEKIYDGACGSGMLLTAAYRRVIRAYELREALNGKPSQANFKTRRELLVHHIYGGDVDEDACQLTAFSLYLALLSDLTPRDLEELRKGGERLPTLANNILRGENGDFFGEASAKINRQRFGIFISNPPWRKVGSGEDAAASMQKWRKRQPEPTPHIPKQQIAAAFALGAADTLDTNGRVTLILPVTIFTSADPTHRDFRTHLLGRFKVEKIVNFSDMRRLIFADAVHPFVVLIATVRELSDRFRTVEHESFEYWTPKTDVSLAFGRLTVHGEDRAHLPVSSLISDESELSVRYWGSAADVSLLRKLQRRGRIGELENQGWIGAKGFHAKDEDKRRPKETWYQDVPEWMANAPFLDTNAFPSDLPVVPVNHLQKFPFERIARVPNRRLFGGPRVMWPDGVHPSGGVKAVYAETEFSCQHTLAILSAPKTEEGRLTARFLAAYFRSPMGLWLLLLLSGSVASERPKLHLQEALEWPFWQPSRHPQPKEAWEILRKVDKLLSKLEKSNNLLQPHNWGSIQEQINSLIYSYFLLSENDVAMVEELATLAGEALQPTSLRHSALMRPLREAPSRAMMLDYAEALSTTLCEWRDATGGRGEIHVATWTARSVPIGATVLSLGQQKSQDCFASDDIIEVLASALKRVADREEDLLVIPDLVVIDGNRIFLVKPLISRFWMRRCAVEDANRLAVQLQSLSLERSDL